MKKILSNKKTQGLARILIYRSGKKYIGVCLDFDIVEEANTKEEAVSQIKEATRGYVINVLKNNLDDDLLNRPAAENYWRKYREYNRFIAAKNEGRVKKITPTVKASSFFAFPIRDIISSKGLCLSY